ncbi:FG-GAP repeat protein [Desulfonema magnum]|uniref:Integrine FG-GAP repeat-containing protein n=1 Tax=Desulfonema magnum TaxID=45655 RepID=A0A975GKN8_9BACT|nr:FG-GAP repeat protein [Desulfonema magnum]QTA84926.1 Integrine FG-GAP repeat-containing protein [Desulfonema magnum]
MTITKTVPPPEIVTFTADPETITAGESSVLTWETANADSVSIDQGIGSVSVSGSLTAQPSETTTYTLTASCPGGTSTRSIIITVSYPFPTVTTGADPVTIQSGESSVLTWTSTDAESCSITPDIGNVDLNGSVTISPTETTTYTVTATGPGGTAAANVEVEVIFPLSVTVIEPDGASDITHRNFRIQWTDVSPDSGTVSVSLFYDTDNSGEDGTLIVSGLSKAPAASCGEYVWNTAEIPEGAYYVYAVINDGVSEATHYSEGMLTVDHTTFSNEIKVTASDAAESDFFGGSVAISGDYAVVGSLNDSCDTYIFRREGTEWVDQTKLGKSGNSVAISGDYAIVGGL